MGRVLDVEQRWPELFAGLEPGQRNAVVQSLASSWHEGWEPNRPDVENLVNFVKGVIDRKEFLLRSVATPEG
ncbi:antitoxin VbhA family protein [Glutamicibacter ardleyensis]|uniref:antitoxin VbhA family protein n=1 Tax=Glutamicibacter ardleyensis TaxID=225894 RepID=UPI003FD10279